jgi:uncharacterized protein (DUF934 family)
MPLIKNGAATRDPYVTVSDDAPLPEGAPVIVTAARFFADSAVLLERNAPVGVIWPNNKNVADLAPFLDSLAVIALVYPNFKDGRAYSQARLLRERYGFRGELRAIGQVLRDQFVFLVRAGFDALDVRRASDAEAFAATLARYTVFYQPTGEGRAAAARLRAEKAPEAQVGEKV